MGDIDEIIAADSDEELGYALQRAGELAAEIGQTVWLYSSGGLFRQTNKKPGWLSKIAAVCYPDGRQEIKRKVKG